MNINPISYINSTIVGTLNSVKEGAVSVWCTVTGKTQVLDSRTKFDAVNIGAVGSKYKEKFTGENPAN